jgi:hypothetical protein
MSLGVCKVLSPTTRTLKIRTTNRAGRIIPRTILPLALVPRIRRIKIQIPVRASPKLLRRFPTIRMTTTRRMVGRILAATKAAMVAATIRAAVGLKTEYDRCELNPK